MPKIKKISLGPARRLRGRKTGQHCQGLQDEEMRGDDCVVSECEERLKGQGAYSYLTMGVNVCA